MTDHRGEQSREPLRRRRAAWLVFFGGLAAAALVAGLVRPIRDRLVAEVCYRGLGARRPSVRAACRERLEAILKRGGLPGMVSRLVRLAVRQDVEDPLRLSALALMCDMPYERLADLAEHDRRLLTATGLAPDRSSEWYRAELLARIGGSAETAVLRAALRSRHAYLREAVIHGLSESRGVFVELREEIAGAVKAAQPALEAGDLGGGPVTTRAGSDAAPAPDLGWALLALSPRAKREAAWLLYNIRDPTLLPLVREVLPALPRQDRERLTDRLTGLGDFEQWWWAEQARQALAAERARQTLADRPVGSRRLLAGRALARVADPAGIDLLLDELEWRLANPGHAEANVPDVVYVLRDLTGENFLNDMPAWRAWWGETRRTWAADYARRRWPPGLNGRPTGGPASLPAGTPAAAPAPG